MKLVILLLFTVCTSICYADTLKVSLINQVQDDPITQREIYNDVKHLMAQLAESLSTTSEYLFSVLVRQAIVDGIFGLILQILVFIGAFTWCTKAIKFNAWAHKVSRDAQYDNDGGYALFWISAMILGFLSIIAICTLQSSLTKLINPEYWALREILQFIRGS